MLASNFLKTSVSNIIYIFLGGLGAILVIPIFIINFGINKYGEWLSIIFFINIITVIFQSKITVDSNHISKIVQNKTNKFLDYFKKTNLILLKQLFLIDILIFIFIFFDNYFLIKFFNNINEYKLIIIILLLSSNFNIYQGNFYSLYRAKKKSYIFLYLSSIKQIIYFALIIFFLIFIKFEEIEILVSITILVLEIFFTIVIRNYYFFIFNKDKNYYLNNTKTILKEKLVKEKKYMLYFVFSEAIFNNLVPIVIGIFLTAASITSFVTHLQIAKIPRLLTMTINTAFQQVMGNIKKSNKESAYNYSMILVSINFWSFFLFYFFLYFVGEFMFNFITQNEVIYFKKYLLIIYTYFFMESIWRSLQTFSLATNKHKLISKLYFVTGIISILLMILLIKNYDFMFVFIAQQLVLLTVSVIIFKNKFKKSHIIKFILFDFFIKLIKLITYAINKKKLKI